MPVRIKILRYVWETGWSGARSMPPWPDGVFAEIFRGANGWSVRDFWRRSTRGRIGIDFDIAPWGILYGQSHETLKDNRPEIIHACRNQATMDGVVLAGFDHVIAFVHEPPANTGIAGADAVLDQTATLLDHYYRQVGGLIGISHPPGADNACVMSPLRPAALSGPAVLPDIDLFLGNYQLCALCYSAAS